MIRILVIEPEAPSRHALRNILEGAGYEVEVAADGDDAAGVHAARPADLVIADLADVGPHHTFPGTRMLATAGGLTARDARAVNTVPVHHTLAKPFRRDDLLTAVRATLSAAPSRPATAAMSPG